MASLTDSVTTSTLRLTAARRVVVKIGSALLVDRKTGLLRQDWLAGLAQDVVWLKSLGKDVILVSSGSIALGRGVLGLPSTTLALEQSQGRRCRRSDPSGPRL